VYSFLRSLFFNVVAFHVFIVTLVVVVVVVIVVSVFVVVSANADDDRGAEDDKDCTLYNVYYTIYVVGVVDWYYLIN